MATTKYDPKLTYTAEQFPAITSAASKKQEMEYLIALKDAILSSGTETYLSSLITPELIEWASQKIADDLAPDIYGAFVQAHRDATSQEIEAGKLRNQMSQMERGAEAMRLTFRDEHIQATARIDGLTINLGEARSNARALIDTINDQTATICQITSERENALAEIVKLKAMIFDLEHKA